MAGRGSYRRASRLCGRIAAALYFFINQYSAASSGTCGGCTLSGFVGSGAGSCTCSALNEDASCGTQQRRRE
ncbi:exported hypothetical protein [Pseudomonas sp. 9AZ]|nr:exported hypothetical protein [Pseudomonas sp. 9AZ]